MEENGQRHPEALSKVASLEVKVVKWRTTTQTIWRMHHLKVANATLTLAKSIWSNHKLSSEVGNVLTKLLCTRLDGDEVFGHCKDLMKKKNDLAGKVESDAVEKEELAKVVVNSQSPSWKSLNSRHQRRGRPSRSWRKSYWHSRRKSWSSTIKAFTRLSGKTGSSQSS